MKINYRIIELVEALDRQTVRQGDKKGKQAHSITFLKIVILDILSSNYYALTVSEVFERIHKDDRLTRVKKESIRSLRYHLNDMVNSNLLEIETVYERDPITFERLKLKKVQAYKLSQKTNGYIYLNIKKSGLDILQSCKTVFEKFEAFPFFDDLNTFIKGYEKDLAAEEIESITSTKFPIVDFDYKMNLSDLITLRDIYFSIEDQVKINFKYHSFPLGDENEGKITNFIGFKPYLIKEHKHRFYLVGKPSFSSDFFTLGIDRIKEIKRDLTDEANFDREVIDVNEIYKHSLGIYSSWSDDNGNRYTSPLKVTFDLKNGDIYNNISYLRSNPIHESQDIDFTNYEANGFVQVFLNVFPDSDLIRHLRSFGVHNLKNIQPDFLDEWVRKK